MYPSRSTHAHTDGHEPPDPYPDRAHGHRRRLVAGHPGPGHPARHPHQSHRTVPPQRPDRRHRGQHDRLLAGHVPALDHHHRLLQHPRDRPQARRHVGRHRQRVRGDLRPLVLPLRRRHLDGGVRRGHRPRGAAGRGVALRRQLVDHEPPAVLRQRPEPAPADRGDRQRQPVQGRPGPVPVAAVADLLPVHVRQDVDHREAYYDLNLQSSEKTALQTMLNTCSS